MMKHKIQVWIMNYINIHCHTILTNCHIDLHVVTVVKAPLSEVPDMEGEESHTRHAHQLPQVTHSPPQHPEGRQTKREKRWNYSMNSAFYILYCI